jgi:hypothetical protein
LHFDEGNTVWGLKLPLRGFVQRVAPLARCTGSNAVYSLLYCRYGGLALLVVRLPTVCSLRMDALLINPVPKSFLISVFFFKF